MKRKDRILLHPKHGLNPSLDICFVCGEAKGIVLLGAKSKKITGQDDAPRELITSIEPCDACRKKYLNDAVLLVECDENNTPSSRFMIMKDEGVRAAFNAEVPKGRIALVSNDIFGDILDYCKKHDEKVREQE